MREPQARGRKPSRACIVSQKTGERKMKIYDFIMLIAFGLGCTTFDFAGGAIRALITGSIAGVYLGWRLKK